MPSDKDDDFNFNETDLNFDDKSFEELSNLSFEELDFSDSDLEKLFGEANQPLQDLSFSDEAFNKFLEEMSSADSELNFDWSEPDSSGLMKESEIARVEPEPILEPDPNLTAKDVAAWMLGQVEGQGALYQREAAWHIRRYFGERFIYLNQNHNPAISREVLKEFLLVSLKGVVWNRRERYWRPRHLTDPPNRRMVDD